MTPSRQGAVDMHFALLHRFQAGGDPQRRGLTAARRPQQAGDLTGLNHEVEAGDGAGGAEIMGDLPKF